MRKKILLTSYFVLFLLYSAWSWILVNPNLYFSTNPFYVAAQNWLQDTFYANRPFVTSCYVVLLVLLFTNFLMLLETWDQNQTRRDIFTTLGLMTLPLLFAYNALSSDIFNYLFNAKMVVVYHDNPHVHTATDYQTDDWTRFMHNVHTPAPYGYGWTLLSLLPYLLGFGKFTLTWLSFRTFNVILLVATVWSLWYFRHKLDIKVPARQLFLFALNPLILIEIIGNSHNDLWMILPALWSLYLVWPRRGHKMSLPRLLSSLVLLTLSASIKFATIVLLPAWLWLLLKSYPSLVDSIAQKLARKKQVFLTKVISWINTYFFDLCALAMFLPLLTDRSQRFHPWYLSWSLVFVPFARSEIAVTSLLILSASAMLRYVPYLWWNNYTDDLIVRQQWITLLPVAIYLIGITIRYCYRYWQTRSSSSQDKT